MSQRQSNMELLRIFSMCLIIFHHCAVHSGFPDLLTVSLSYNMLTIGVGYFLGKLGVNLFMLTTGYFQVNGSFKWAKLVSLLAQLLFYSILTSCVGIFVGAVRFTGCRDLLRILFPAIRNQYWFATAYVVIYIFSPYANLLIKSMDEKTFRRFLLTSLILYSVIPTVFGLIYNSSAEAWLYYNGMIGLFIMYFVGAYIRLYSFRLERAFVCAFGAFAFMALSIPIIYALDRLFGGKPLPVVYFIPPNTAPMVILSVWTFCAFRQLNIPHTLWINRVASATFGIYLLHDSSALRAWIWRTLLRFAEKWDSPTLIPQMLAACACIFLVGMVVDFARQALERVTLKKWLSSAWFQRLETRFDVNVTEKEI